MACVVDGKHAERAAKVIGKHSIADLAQISEDDVVERNSCEMPSREIDLKDTLAQANGDVGIFARVKVLDKLAVAGTLHFGPAAFQDGRRRIAGFSDGHVI